MKITNNTRVDSKSIALLAPNLACGGAERVILSLAKGFLDRGYRVDLLLLRKEGELLSLVPKEANVVAFKKHKPRQVIGKLAFWLRANRPLVLLSSLSQLAWTAGIACWISGTATRCIFREESTLTKALDSINPLEAKLRLWLLRKFCAEHPFVCASKKAAEDLARTLGSSSISDVFSIPNPVIDSEFFRRAKETVSHPWFETKDQQLILAVGRLHQAKGFDILLEAFAKVYDKRKDVRLLILGEGLERPALERQRQELSLEQVVDMPGYTANPLPYMVKSDVFVLSSRREGLGNVLIEALACRARIVATDCLSGPREILDHGRYGYLVPPENPEMLAATLLTALEDDRAPRVSQEWLKRYHVDQAVRRHLEVMGLPDYAPPALTDRH